MGKPVPTLSQQAWIKDNPVDKISHLLAYYFGTEGEQQYVFKDTVKPIQLLVKEFGTNISRFNTELQTSLYTLLSRYFENVDVTISDRENKVNPSSAIIVIEARVYDDGKPYSITSAYEQNGSVFKLLIDQMNG